MNHFSPTSESRLVTCHPDLQAIAREVLQGYDIIILEGHRDEAKQMKFLAAGSSKAAFGESPHNFIPALAVDIAPCIAKYGGIPKDPSDQDWDRLQFAYLGGLFIATARRMKKAGLIEHEIRWGGDWNRNGYIVRDQSFVDMPHFEIDAWRELVAGGHARLG